MGRGLVAVGLYAHDLGLEQLDALGQLVLRIGVEALLRERIRRVAAPPGEIVVLHCTAASQLRALAVNGKHG